ncbi:MAG TPA: alpha/beta hydrolase [Acidimicrobiales bacterium]|nr:alpha/beta hydrolase [Acidimicrobiales bacterium]
MSAEQKAPASPGLVRGALDVLRRVAADPRTVDLVGVPSRTASYLVRTWSRGRRGAQTDGPVPVRVSPWLATQVLVDEVMISAMKDPALFPRDHDYAAAGADMRAASELFERSGWLADPASYHRDPPVPEWEIVTPRRSLDLRYDHVCFPSEFAPRADEPGRERWLSYEANRTVHAWMLRHRRGPRPWLVCLHGFGMGWPLADMRGFRVRQLYRSGLNILLPVLPLHGPRAMSSVRGQGFMSIDLIDSLHGLTQSCWDVRRALAWLRQEQGAEVVGVYGLSLGAHVASLLAGLDPDLACVIAGIPEVDLPDLYRRHSPPDVRRLAEHAGALGETAAAVHRVVSPLAMEARIPTERRFIFAGLGDRMSTFDHARRLWLHWGRPRLATYEGGHVGFFFSGAVTRFVREALISSGLVLRPEPREVGPAA